MLTIAKNFAYLEAALAIGWAIFFAMLTPESKRRIGHFPFVAVTALTALLFFSPAFAVLHAALFLLPIVLGRTRGQLLTILVAGSLCVPGLSVYISVAGLSLFYWTLQASLGMGGLVALATTRADPDAEPFRWNLPLVLFLTLMAIITLRGTAPTNWLRSVVALMTGYGTCVIVIDNCLRSVVNRQTMLTTLAGIGSMLATVLLYESRVHWPLYSVLFGKYGIAVGGVMMKFRGGSMRAFGPLDEATAAGFALVITFAAALACSRVFQRGPARYVVPVLIGLGTLAPQSRGGMIGAAVVLMCYAFYRFGVSGLMKAVAAASPFALLYFARASFKAVDLTEAQGTVDYRQQLFTRGMQEFWKHPLLGDQLNTVMAHMEDMRQGEGIIDFVNSYLYFALTLGVVGVAIFCFVLYYPVVRLFFQRKRFKQHAPTASFAGFAFGSLIAAGIMLAFTSVPMRPTMITLVIAGAGTTMRLSRRAGSSARARGDRPLGADIDTAHSATPSPAGLVVRNTGA